MDSKPSKEGYPKHLSRILVISANNRSILRTNDPHEAAEMHARTPGSRVKFLLGLGTAADPTHWVDVGDVE